PTARPKSEPNAITGASETLAFSRTPRPLPRSLSTDRGRAQPAALTAVPNGTAGIRLDTHTSKRRRPDYLRGAHGASNWRNAMRTSWFAAAVVGMTMALGAS